MQETGLPSYKVTANQEINPTVLSTMDNSYNKPGASTLHEVTEAYQGALISQAAGISSPMAGVGSVYQAAHGAATPQSGQVNQVLYDVNGVQTNVLSQATRVEYTTQNGAVIMTYP